MRILLTGSKGQLGSAILASAPLIINGENVEIFATSRENLDLSDENSCKAIIKKYLPNWVINAGAYTSVDKAESQPQLAIAVNGYAPAFFAETLLQTGGQLLQLSTDSVFDGNQVEPYKPNQNRNPLNIYGESKLMGELAIEKVLNPTNQGTILRTSWLMGSVGHSFIKTMLGIHKNQISCHVISDQFGCPTSSINLANTIWRIIAKKNKDSSLPPALHYCDKGVASWFDIALATGEIAKEIGLLKNLAKIESMSSFDYPTPAARPKYSTLDCQLTYEMLGIKSIDWEIALKEILTLIPIY